MKALAQGTLFVVFAVVAGLVGLVVWIGWEVGNRAIAALDAIGPGLFIGLEVAYVPRNPNPHSVVGALR